MKYDATLKELLQSGLPGLWQALGLQQPKQLLTVELPSVRLRKPDFLARFDNGAIVHLELQGQNDLLMEWRELEYYQFIFSLFRQPPIQIVLYFGTEPMTMKNHIAFECLQFRYRLIDLRALSIEYLIASGAPGDTVLAILAEAGADPQGVKRIVQELSKLPEHEQRDWFEKLMILAGVRNAEQTVREEAQKMGISLDIRDNLFFKEAYAAGIEDGMEKGELTLLQRQLERRFGSLPEWVREQLAKADRDALEEMGVRLLEAARLEDVFNGSANQTN